MSAAITVKGIREGVLITLETGEIPDLLLKLEELVESRKSFFQGGRVALQVGNLELSHECLSRLCSLFQGQGVSVWAVIGANPVTRAAAEALDLETTFPPQPAVEVPEETLGPELASDEGILVHRTLRSGQSVTYAGYIVVIGDVNPGAEIIAGGDVIVWGHLRGTVHAGALGDPGRFVCALDLSPTQLRIGNYIARPPEGRRRPKDIRPERAFVSNGQIVAERWK